MGRFFKKLRDIWAHEELRRRLGITLGFILVYRIGSFIVIPGVDSDALQEQMSALGGGGLGSILSLFTGGAFSRASIFALGIMPYISASIIMQLMGLAVPTIQKMQSEGESGRKKINQWTRFLTIAITLVQAPGYLASTVVSVPGAVADPSSFWWFSAVLILTSSTLLIMYLGERITERGVGNGISLLIMIGIIATFPQAIIQEFNHPNTNFFFFLVEIAALLVVIGLSVALVQAVRRVPVEMTRLQANPGSFMPQGAAARSYIPLKVNSSGVMPIIFAQAIMFVPLYLTQNESLADNEVLIALGDFNGFWYNLLVLPDDCGLHVFLHGHHSESHSRWRTTSSVRTTFVPGSEARPSDDGVPRQCDLQDHLARRHLPWVDCDFACDCLYHGFNPCPGIQHLLRRHIAADYGRCHS